MKKEEDKRSRRKSGRFLGLTLKVFSKETSEKPEEDGDKVSLLRRFGSRRSSKKKSKRDQERNGRGESDTTSSGNQDGTDSGTPSLSDGLHSDDAGHTPKAKHSHAVDGTAKSPWGSDSDGDNCHEAKNNLVKRHTSLKERSRRLKRSMSALCGSSRSKLIPPKATDEPVPETKAKGRRSFGGSALGAAITRSRSRLISKRVSESVGRTEDIESEENVKNGKSETKIVCQKKNGIRGDKSARRRSFDFLGLSARKNRPKRESYDQMNKQRDELSPDEKSHPPKEKKQHHIAQATVRRHSSSFKCGVNSDDKMESGEKSVDERSRRPSLRRKSLGVSTPRGARDRRCSGVYATSATPTYMTCGFIMTDSPPDDLPYLEERNVYTTVSRDGAKQTSSSSTEAMPHRSSPLGYNDDDLPWVAMKRKRRSELLDKSVVNRCNAGHTPLPPRKKHKLYHERLIN
ncbi:hypothetical protein LSH36_193g01047 [Paralvinella palmiformis]|uniref:Uncharacterized protein n=1 Tax=Paralvinella palmiformis TaxID=53620 RepID=A0AAD9N6I8_9ANNE|nr:hypothetical protein LSH36_193g01047 [Paralvinella palmiformis]